MPFKDAGLPNNERWCLFHRLYYTSMAISMYVPTWIQYDLFGTRPLKLSWKSKGLQREAEAQEKSRVVTTRLHLMASATMSMHVTLSHFHFMNH